MKVLIQSLAGLLCSAALVSMESLALAGGPGCASCAGGAAYAAPPQAGMPGLGMNQGSALDWGPMPTACCNRPQRDMCDWWAGYCRCQKITPCMVAPCRGSNCGCNVCGSNSCGCNSCAYGQGGWGEGWLYPSLASGCHRASHRHGGCCGASCCAPSCCAPSCCAPACSAPCGGCCDSGCGADCGSACGSGCGGGFHKMFGGLFGKGCHCTNVIGGSSGSASCGCCPPQRCRKCPKPCCAAPCCPAPPCRSRLTFGCCNDAGLAGEAPVVRNPHVDNYYQDTSARSNEEEPIRDRSGSIEDISGSAPELNPAPAAAPSIEPIQPTPARPAPKPAPEVLSPTTSAPMPLEIEIPALNGANEEVEETTDSI